MAVLIAIASVLVGCAIGIPLSIWATAGLRKKNKRAFAMASALLFAFGIYNPQAVKIVEAREDTDHAKRQKAGDPPEP